MGDAEPPTGLPDWADVEATDGGWYLTMEMCPGETDRLFISEGDVGPDQTAGLAFIVAFMIDSQAHIRPTPEECEVAAATAAAASQAAEAAAVEKAKECREVFVEIDEGDSLGRRFTCPGDDLWEFPREARCGEQGVVAESERVFACRLIALGAGPALIGSPPPAGTAD